MLPNRQIQSSYSVNAEELNCVTSEEGEGGGPRWAATSTKLPLQQEVPKASIGTAIWQRSFFSSDTLQDKQHIRLPMRCS